MVSEHASPLACIGGVDAGGQNVHVASLASQLAREGHEVTVYTRRHSRDLPTRVMLHAGVAVEHVSAGPPEYVPKDLLLPWMAQFGTCLRRRFAASRPDVVHAHFWMSGLAARRGVEGLGIPVIQTFHALGAVKRRHQGADDTSPPSRLRHELEIAASVSRIIATCSDELFELVRLGVDKRKVRVVPCGVNVDQFDPRGPVAPRGCRPRILALGRLVPRKGVDDIIRALPALPEVELIVAGGPPRADLTSDPEARRLQQLAHSLTVSERVTFLGAVGRTDIPALLRSADIVACMPWYEPFGIVPLEAMACGKPVVASAVGGMLDTVVDGVTGALVPPRNPALLAERLLSLLAQPELLDRYGKAGIKRARSRYCWSRIAQLTASVYDEVTSAAPTAAEVS
jgi:glycosyltransferase involved in cell wall biosynthesis